MNRKISREIVETIIDDLNDRNGLGISCLDDDIQEEIKEAWIDKTDKTLSNYVPQPMVTFEADPPSNGMDIFTATSIYILDAVEYALDDILPDPRDTGDCDLVYEPGEVPNKIFGERYYNLESEVTEILQNTFKIKES